ncbi:MAG: M15 family metallopeptidase [Actinomycetota bacterium]
MKRYVALITALVFVACGSRSDMPVARLPERNVAELSLPTPVALTAAIRVELRAMPARPALKAIGRARDVGAVAPVTVITTRVKSARRSARLRTATVDPISFRSFAPAPTRDADFVWTSLAAGQTVVTRRAVNKLAFKDPGTVTMERAEYSVGAFADNGTPNLADLIVAGTPAAARGRPTVLIGLNKGSVRDAARIARRHLRGITRIRPLTPMAAPPQEATPAAPLGRTEGDLIGAMTFRILKSGYIEPDPAWIHANIASGTVPILGRITCHRLLFPQLAAALGEIQEAGLASKIDPSDYGGCYVPRFIDRDPRRGLSFHAFGLAVDMNVSENYLGREGKIDPRVVETFERWGFEWGGRWSRPDPMHFQLARLIRT